MGAQHAGLVERLMDTHEIPMMSLRQKVHIEELDVLVTGVVVAAEKPGVLGNDDAFGT